MKITATYHGESVTIVGIIPVGSMIYVAYIDNSSVLKLAKDFFASDVSSIAIATGATAI